MFVFGTMLQLDLIHQLVSRILVGFSYMCQLLLHTAIYFYAFFCLVMAGFRYLCQLSYFCNILLCVFLSCHDF
jgi:hypothetical protein